MCNRTFVVLWDKNYDMKTYCMPILVTKKKRNRDECFFKRNIYIYIYTCFHFSPSVEKDSRPGLGIFLELILAETTI